MNIEEWNKMVPVGTPVRYYPRNLGIEWHDSVTRSTAYELCDGTAVVLLEGMVGGRAIDNIEVR
jgi:hypothetical protein